MIRRSGTAARSRASRLGATALILSLAAGVAGCTGQTPTGPDPTTAPTTQTQAPEQPAPELIPGGSAEQNLPFFEHVLRGFGEGAEPVEGRPIVDALVAAGFDRDAMQVSFDRTQTNLVADNIFVSVRIGAECLIGQVVTGDRSSVAVVEPAVGPDGSICLIGSTRPIDWDPAA